MKNNIRILIIIFGVSLIFPGCSVTRTVNRSELEQAKTVWKEPKVSLWYYRGSKDGYHYFQHRDLDGEKNFRISESELDWPNTFPLTRDRKEWKTLEWGVRQGI
jgi:hypothetical protein